MMGREPIELHSRRRVLKTLGGATAVAWTAPQVISMAEAGAATTYVVSYDANMNLTAGGPVPFTVSGDGDMTNGGPITMDTPGCTFVSGTGSGSCLGSSPPNQPFSEPGVVGPATTITFPDRTTPESCFYSGFTLTVSCAS